MKTTSKFTFFTLYLIYVLDLVGLVFVYIVVSPLIIDPSSTMLPQAIPLSSRNIIVGLLFATYPFAQFFAAPILGDLSDRFGRKRILVISTLGTTLSIVLSAISIYIASLVILFISRFLTGIFARNLTVTQATVANLAPDEKKASYMALFSTVGGIGWTVGPFIAAFLSDPKIVSFFDYATPFWFLAIIFFLSFLFLIFSLHESSEPKPKQKLHLHKIAPNLLSVFKIKNVLVPFLASFITIFGWMMYQGFLAPYLIEKYGFVERWEGYAYAISSFFWFVGGFLSNKWLLKHHNPKRVILIPMFLSGIAIFGYLFAFQSYWIWPLIAVANSMQAIVTACFFALFAQLVPANSQGKIFGSWNAGFAMASSLGPFLASVFVGFQVNLPYVIASGILLLTAIYYLLWYRRHQTI